MLPLGLSGNLGGKAPKPLETPFQTQSPSHYHNPLTLQQGCHTSIMPDSYPYLLPTNCTNTMPSKNNLGGSNCTMTTCQLSVLLHKLLTTQLSMASIAMCEHWLMIWTAVLQVWQLQNYHLHPQNHHKEDKHSYEPLSINWSTMYNITCSYTILLIRCTPISSSHDQYGKFDNGSTTSSLIFAPNARLSYYEQHWACMTLGNTSHASWHPSHLQQQTKPSQTAITTSFNTISVGLRFTAACNGD